MCDVMYANIYTVTCYSCNVTLCIKPLQTLLHNNVVRAMPFEPEKILFLYIAASTSTLCDLWPFNGCVIASKFRIALFPLSYLFSNLTMFDQQIRGGAEGQDLHAIILQAME